MHTCKSARPLRNTQAHTEIGFCQYEKIWEERVTDRELGPCSKVCVCVYVGVHTHGSDPPDGAGGGGNRWEVR